MWDSCNYFTSESTKLMIRSLSYKSRTNCGLRLIAGLRITSGILSGMVIWTYFVSSTKEYGVLCELQESSSCVNTRITWVRAIFLSASNSSSWNSGPQAGDRSNALDISRLFLLPDRKWMSCIKSAGMGAILLRIFSFEVVVYGSPFSWVHKKRNLVGLYPSGPLR